MSDYRFMNSILLSMMAIMELSLLIAVAYPCLVVYFRERHSPDLVVRAKRHLALSVFVLLVLFSQAVGISLMNHAPNVLVVISAILCCFSLVLFSFNLNSKLLRMPIVGLLSLFGWILLVLFLLLGLIDNSGPITEGKVDGVYCRKTTWGFAGNDSGETFEVFKRYLIIDMLVERRTDVFTSSTQPLAKTETTNLCEAAFSK